MNSSRKHRRELREKHQNRLGNPSTEYGFQEQYAYEPQNDIYSFDDAHSRANNKQFSVEQEPDIEYERVEHYLAIDSGDRDRSKYPNPSNYIVHLSASSNQTGAVANRSYKNVCEVGLIQATLPDQAASGSIFDEPYLLLKVSEFDGLNTTFNATNSNLNSCFAIMNLDIPYSTGDFFNINLDIVSKTPKVFRSNWATLDKLSIQIVDKNGNFFNFGTDATPPTAPTKSLQHLLVFKIVTMEPKIGHLNARGVY